MVEAQVTLLITIDSKPLQEKIEKRKRKQQLRFIICFLVGLILFVFVLIWL